MEVVLDDKVLSICALRLIFPLTCINVLLTTMKYNDSESSWTFLNFHNFFDILYFSYFFWTFLNSSEYK